MLLIIKNRLDRIIVFIAVQFVAYFLCAMDLFLKKTPIGLFLRDAPLVLWMWLFVGVTGFVVIVINAKQNIKRTGVLRFFIAFVLMLPVCILLWFWTSQLVASLYFGVDREPGPILLVQAPLLALWTLASLITLTLWPFSYVRNEDEGLIE